MPVKSCVMLRLPGTIVCVAGGHVGSKRCYEFCLRQQCRPGKEIVGSGVRPSRSLRRRTERASGRILGGPGRIWTIKGLRLA